MVTEISRKGKPTPLGATKWWVVEHINTWDNARKKFVWCTPDQDQHLLADGGELRFRVSKVPWTFDGNMMPIIVVLIVDSRRPSRDRLDQGRDLFAGRTVAAEEQEETREYNGATENGWQAGLLSQHQPREQR
jgi:hypothetical protein